MTQRELIVPLYLKDGQAVSGREECSLCQDGDAVRIAEYASNAGADALLVFDLSSGDAAHDAAIAQIREIASAVDIPVYGGGNIRRMEDVKKLIYAGCRKVFLNFAKKENISLAKEVSERFGREKILACTPDAAACANAQEQKKWLGGIVCPDQRTISLSALSDFSDETGAVRYCMTEDCRVEHLADILASDAYTGAVSSVFGTEEGAVMECKHALHARGILVNTYEASIAWKDVRVNGDGLLPVVVQDYRTQEVLMVAYMNQEAFEMTIRSGRMTYWSRSRQELWIKGLTSGHFQYVRELCIDCDNDTLLAKVAQVGAACHTGNRSCFYRTILKKEYAETNPLKVFEDVYAVIQDRKEHPKEGSYTNYLFDKGIDKILKKVGEEATELVIAAKNPDPEEIKYELSDFLYHAMVLMVERGVSWEDITRELARR